MVDAGQLITFVERSSTGNLFFSGEVVPLPAENGLPDRVSVSGFFHGADEEQKGTFSYICQDDPDADHSDGVHVNVISGERDSIFHEGEPDLKSMQIRLVFGNGGRFSGSACVGDDPVFMDGKFGPQGHAAAHDAAACAAAEIAATKESFDLGADICFTLSGSGHEARNISSASLYDWVGIYPSTAEVTARGCGACWMWMRDQDGAGTGDTITFANGLGLPPGRYVCRYFWGADTSQECACSAPFAVSGPSWCGMVNLQVEGDTLGLHADRVDTGEELFVRWVAPAGRTSAGDSISVAPLRGPGGGGGARDAVPTAASVEGVKAWSGGVRRDLQGRTILEGGRADSASERGGGLLGKAPPLETGEVELPGLQTPGWYECRYHVRGVGADPGAVAARSHPFEVVDA